MTDYPSGLINSFEVLDEIEFGAYGLVNRVMERSNAYLGNHKLYAMKVENKRKPKDIIKYMESELEVLSWIFPYKIHSDYYFENSYNAYIIIDYCENGVLLKEIENKSKIGQYFEEDEIWKYFIQICFGLEFLSSRGFIHHDLHPKNIFLDESKDIKLGDFGISHYIDNKKDHKFCNIFLWKNKNKEGDIWAAGCVLYYLLTLKHPFEKNLKKGKNYMPIKNNYSDEIKSFADWCLRKKRNDRPTINQIITHQFIVNKTINLGIAIPQKSAMRAIYNPIEEIKEIASSQIPLLKSHKNVENSIITLQELKEKTAEILNKQIDSEIEQDFRRICLTYENDTSIYDPPLIQAYQDYIKNYSHLASLYKIVNNKERNLLITYNTENEKKEIKVLEDWGTLDDNTCIAKLPDNKLFCFSNTYLSGTTLIIDENGRIKGLPPGTRCYKASLIYFNSSVYRFGGEGYDAMGGGSEKFDFVNNQWFKLPSMPKSDYYFSNGIIFKNNFLLPGVKGKNILIYSSDIESYSVIPYEFTADRHKILIYAEKRLYLIEWWIYGSVSESEVEDEYNWKRIMANKLNIYTTRPSCSLYNKGAIYIGYLKYESTLIYYKFYLNEKFWTPL